MHTHIYIHTYARTHNTFSLPCIYVRVNTCICASNVRSMTFEMDMKKERALAQESMIESGKREREVREIRGKGGKKRKKERDSNNA